VIQLWEKILRYQGLLREALELLGGVLQDSLLDDYFEGTGWYGVLLSGVADLYCGLGQPVDAEKPLQRELNPMRGNGRKTLRLVEGCKCHFQKPTCSATCTPKKNYS
jgi:hypothetical protein